MYDRQAASLLEGTPWREWLSCNEGQLLHIFEPECGIFIAESKNVIERALALGYEPISFLIARGQMQGDVQQMTAQHPEASLYVVEEAVMDALAGCHIARGVLCAMRRKEIPAPETVCAGASRIAVIENVVNPTNLGAIFRSAAALGAEGVLISSGCTDPLYRRAVRVSMGTVFQIPWSILPEAPDASAGIRRLQAQGFVCAAMALRQDSCAVDDPRITGAEKLAVVLGNEGDGLTDATIRACDYTVMIPMMRGVDSLNVAAASAVAFWAMCRKPK